MARTNPPTEKNETEKKKKSPLASSGVSMADRSRSQEEADETAIEEGSTADNNDVQSGAPYTIRRDPRAVERDPEIEILLQEGQIEEDEGEAETTREPSIDNADDLAATPERDLRYGGEDISGMSEWTMRAHALQLDDGLDAGDYDRPDSEILESVQTLISERLPGAGCLEVTVEAGKVRLAGRLARAEDKISLEDAILDVPGVVEVLDELNTRP